MSENSLLDSYRIILNVISLKAKNTHAVFCLETGRVLAFTNWMQTAKQMESERNVRVWYYINRAGVIPRAINLNLPFQYVFDAVSSVFVKKPLTEDEVRRFIVYSEKSAVYDIVHRNISYERDHIRSNIALQELVYKRKYDEAVLVLSSVDIPDNIPYIRAHCELTGEDVVQTARKIVDKHNFVEARLLNTEIVRTKYTRKLRECENLTAINLILDEFNRETSIYGRV